MLVPNKVVAIFVLIVIMSLLGGGGWEVILCFLILVVLSSTSIKIAHPLWFDRRGNTERKLERIVKEI